jgi:O-antigen/teichoic acid export membrane protein
MAALKDTLFMGLSTTVRMVFGLLTFVALARLLGPEAFGVLMLWLSVATLLAMIANYGFTTYLLREIGHKPQLTNTILNDVFGAKLLLSTVVLVLALFAVPFLPVGVRWLFLLLLLAMLADSTSDFLNVGYRVTNRYSSETRIATAASIGQCAIVAGAVWYATSVQVAAAGILVSRLCILAMTWLNQRQYFAELKPSPVDRAISRLRQGRTYAADYGLQSLIGQVDNLVLNHFLGPAAVGLHQAGMRIFLGGSQIAGVLGNVLIPRVSAAMGRSAEIQPVAQRVQTVFFGAGAVFGLALAVGAQALVSLLYGDKFQGLADLLPWFGLLFFVRFVASGFGLLLTAAGRQALRAKANLIHWIAILACAAMLVPIFGNLGWIWSLILGNLLLASVYAIAVNSVAKLSVLNASLALLSPLGFVPFLHLP